MNRAFREDGIEEIVKYRREHLGKSLSISYNKPLKIVRGKLQYLYDHNGQQYLDGVNNVAQVGHCHPDVVSAGQAQMELLCTNTRYLGDQLVSYVKELLSTMPSQLSVCYLTCSGSEANELALRLARTYTQKRDVVVVDWAYHGNTSSLVELSPYKFKRNGGFPRPDYVHVVDVPDGFRGIYKYDDPDLGKKYAEQIREKFRESKNRIAAFFCESAMGCAGQIILPPGYLKHAYEIVREGGGVCVADEVQVGFGRLGECFWGFQCQGVVPDIITLGKPIGNGHPMGAVVTTKKIADVFANGMEYFNTFGGNNVSCAIGLAVLKVIKQEKLQQNASELGKYIVEECKKLQKSHDLIGDVRGSGLFIGIELVNNKQTLSPATTEANHVIQLLRENFKILASTDGPYDNVIKIKPPLCWTKENAKKFVDCFDESLNLIKKKSSL